MNARSYTTLVFVIGASVGALIGLVFIKTSPWLILVGAAVGALVVGLIGLRVGVSGTPLADAIDDSALEAGCCLMELVGAGCFGCGTLTGLLVAIVCVVGLHRFGHRPVPTPPLGSGRAPYVSRTAARRLPAL